MSEGKSILFIGGVLDGEVKVVEKLYNSFYETVLTPSEYPQELSEETHPSDGNLHLTTHRYCLDFFACGGCEVFFYRYEQLTKKDAYLLLLKNYRPTP